MSTVTTTDRQEMPLTHAGLALALLGGGLFVPGLLTWPFYLLIPLTLYSLIVMTFTPLRRSVTWLRVGRLDWAVWGITSMVVAVSAAALVIWFA
jgi:hypothetical protein